MVWVKSGTSQGLVGKMARHRRWFGALESVQPKMTIIWMLLDFIRKCN